MSHTDKIVNRLMELGAPTDFNWYCVQIEDVLEDGDDFAVCGVCGHPEVRYLHHMRHDDYDGEVNVGCVCAGILEGNPSAAKDREREMKNRAKRRATFANGEWRPTKTGNFVRKYKGTNIFINKCRGGYNVYCDGRTCWNYKNSPINSFDKAVLAAFDLVEA